MSFIGLFCKRDLWFYRSYYPKPPHMTWDIGWRRLREDALSCRSLCKWTSSIEAHRHTDVTWHITYMTWAGYSVYAHELSIRDSSYELSIRVTNCAYDITWDITDMTWAEYSVCGIPCALSVYTYEWATSLLYKHTNDDTRHTAVCCSVLQCVAVCCNVLQCVAVCCSVLQCVAVCFFCTGTQMTIRDTLQCVAICCSVCSVLCCVVVCCSVSQCVAFAQAHNWQYAALSGTQLTMRGLYVLCHFTGFARLSWSRCLPATHCDTLQHTATHYKTLQSTTWGRCLPATHCDTLQHTTTHCNTLQHTAEHYVR